MRDIKFRAWDGKKMSMDFFLDATNGNVPVVDEGGAVTSLSWKRDWKVMQYTGLKDKSGVEIYEGDILLCDDANEDHEQFKTEVWFHNGQFLTRHYGFPVHSWSGKEKSWCEVIGNIHQNPELI